MVKKAGKGLKRIYSGDRVKEARKAAEEVGAIAPKPPKPPKKKPASDPEKELKKIQARYRRKYRGEQVLRGAAYAAPPLAVGGAVATGLTIERDKRRIKNDFELTGPQLIELESRLDEVLFEKKRHSPHDPEEAVYHEPRESRNKRKLLIGGGLVATAGGAYLWSKRKKKINPPPITK